MTYRITGLDPAPWKSLFGLSDAELARHDARRVIADATPGYPCRVSLEDAPIGSALLLVPHTIARPGSPYAFSYAIFVREGAEEPALFEDEVPAVLASRVLSLRGFDEDGLVVSAMLAQPGDADATIHGMLATRSVATIDVHNAIPGCFAARVERTGR